MPIKFPSFALVLAALAISACAVDESTVSNASAAASSAAFDKEIQDQYEKTQDFDRIAEDGLDDMDTSSLPALE